MNPGMAPTRPSPRPTIVFRKRKRPAPTAIRIKPVRKSFGPPVRSLRGMGVSGIGRQRLAFFQGDAGGFVPEFLTALRCPEDNKQHQRTDKKAAANGDDGNPGKVAEVSEKGAWQPEGERRSRVVDGMRREGENVVE